MTHPVRTFYDEHAQTEWDRADDPYSHIEYLSALALIERYFPPAGHVIDIGGGPGRYTIDLLKRGYSVTLLDLSEQELAIARQRIDSAGLRAEAILQGDACDLAVLPDTSFDAALHMGALYHLHDAQNRAAALRELHRILKPGAIAIAAYLNAWGLIRTGVADFPTNYEDSAFTDRMLDEGGLGIWYWSNPERAQAEVQAAGFELITYAGAEGCVGGIRSLITTLADQHPAAYQNILRLAVQTSQLPQFRDGADHLQLVIKKPDPSA
jgi:S-adenosylmethionine-dependent methyltransferase